MADFDRCYCGAMSHTIDGLCYKHSQELSRLNPKPPEPEKTTAQLLDESNRAAWRLAEEVKRLREERDLARRKISSLRKQITLVRIGDMTIDEVEL